VPRLYAWCEANGLTYTIGMIPNRWLVVIAAPLLSQALAQSKAQGGSKVRLAGETAYQARTWIHPRRVVYKAEALGKGPNTRFVVTTRSEDRWSSTTGTGPRRAREQDQGPQKRP